jgi:hypothetical protein
MTTYTVQASLTVSGDSVDRAMIEGALDAGLKELPALAARYGLQITDATARVEEV